MGEIGVSRGPLISRLIHVDSCLHTRPTKPIDDVSTQEMLKQYHEVRTAESGERMCVCSFSAAVVQLVAIS